MGNSGSMFMEDDKFMIDTMETVGDIDQDGKVNALDLLVLRKKLVDLPIEGSFDPVAADLNKDGNIDILDLVRLRKYLVNSSTPINETNADLDGDGTVALRDLVLLRKLLVGAEP